MKTEEALLEESGKLGNKKGGEMISLFWFFVRILLPFIFLTGTVIIYLLIKNEKLSSKNKVRIICWCLMVIASAEIIWMLVCLLTGMLVIK
ncbi:MAG: hypothetical protein LBM13_04810 [Candidatus Ancillula sp.]|jgi:hypothetical protein|nr:hypothetical protein [Candidatus Ancillula sp.]